MARQVKEDPAKAAAALGVELVRLFDEQHESLTYGPDPLTAIQFGPKAGMPPGFALVPADHPLLEALLRDEPSVRIWRGPEVVTEAVYVCPFDGAEYKTIEGFRRHAEKAHGSADSEQSGTGGQPAG